MKKWMKIAGLVMLFALPVAAQAEDFTYTTNNGTITINQYIGSGGVVDIPETIDGLPVTRIAAAFYFCTSLTSVTIPNSITNIGDNAFTACSSLTSVTIGTNVTSIGNSFDSCTSLTNVIIPNSVTNVGYRAFACCTNLTSLKIGANVAGIEETAFANLTSLPSITVDETNPSYSSAAGVLFNKDQTKLIQYPCGKTGGYTIPGGVTNIGNNAFSGCTRLISIAIPNSVTSIGNTDGVLRVPVRLGILSIPGGTFGGCTSLTNVVVPNSVTNIGVYTFSSCTNLINVTVSGNVTALGTGVFGGCTSLNSITIPDSVTSIGSSAFGSCTSLTSITIGTNVTSIGDGAFYGCSGLTNALIDNSVTYIGRGAFQACTGLTSVTIPFGITTVSRETFRDCTRLTSITIPSSVTFIDLGAFQACTSLTNITIPSSVISIEIYAFYSCTSLTKVLIPDSVTYIGDRCFQYCTSVTNVTIPGGVTTIGSYAFADCTSVTAITVGSFNPAYISVDGVLFNKDQTRLIQYPCGKTGGYTITNSVNTIGDRAFSGCSGLTSVTIGTNVTRIASFAFNSCTGLTNVTIPNSVTTIGVVDDGSLRVPVKLTSLSPPSEGVFGNCTNLKSITIPDSVTNIVGSAFCNCTNLTSITIPSGLGLINDGMFFGCSSLNSVTIPSGVTNIGHQAFAECSSLTGIIIPSGVTKIGLVTFFNCGSLTNVFFQGNAPSVYSTGYSGVGEYYGTGADVFSGDNNATVYRLAEATGWPAVPTTWHGRPTALRAPDLYLLTVDNGTGGGSYTNQQMVNITAGTAPVGKIFDRWIGDTQYVASVTSSTATVTMPAQAITLTAIYKDAYYSLSVVSGDGSGLYTNRAQVIITASNAPVGKAFDRWTGATQYVAGVTSATATVTMPATNITLTATFKTTFYAMMVTGGTGSGSYTNGQKVTITATVPVGMKFDRWTGATSHVASVTSSPTVVTMPPNATSLTAVLKDIQKPVLTLSSPLTGARLTNAAVTVTGKATDNSGAVNVLIQLNNSVWATNNTALSTTNWTASLTLQPGSNSVKVCARDATDNSSATNTLNLTYAVMGTLTIQTNGVGRVARTPTGEPEVGKSYTLTAAAGAGSVFSNWTGAVSNPTNKVTTFTMTSNMTIRANFTDNAKPTIAITAPTALQKVYGTNGDFVVRGTATDNLALSNVMVSVNGASPVPASTTTNIWKNWSLPVTLLSSTNGTTNTIAAYSRDTTGNTSATVTVKCVYTETGTLNIITNGPGKVTVAPAGPLLLGKTYTLTAAANAGAVFSNWTGDVVIGNPTGKVVKVTLNATNKTVAVTANFTDTAKPTVTITLPTANLRITNTNPVYTVKGTATDNSAVATVKVRLNSGDWTNAATTNAWKSWSVPVTLVTGTNMVRAYSIDTAGNNSSTTSVACIYPVVTIDVAAYANLSVGGRWNYRQTEGRDIETRAIEVIETTIKNGHSVYLIQEYTDWGSPDDQFFWSSDFSAGLFDTGGVNDNGQPTETTFYWQPFMPKLFKTFVPGTEITTKCTRSDMTGFITGKGKTVRERVTVPAGTYDCWKVSGTATFNGQVSSDTSWYAENVGLVKRLQDGCLWELTSYVPPASSDPMGIPSSGQDVAPAPTPQAAIVVDGSSKDWTDVPRSAFSYSSVTQEVAVALDGNNIALLLNGCPFSTSDTMLVYFKLRLTYGTADNRHTVDLWTSGSVLYAMVDGQVITGLEAVLLDGVLEVKIPVEQVPSQVTIEEVGCGMDLGGGTMTELFKFSP
jgi:hypothetical protein